jgi:hypothetical protein
MSNHRQWADGPILDIMDRHDRLLADRAAAVELVRELREALVFAHDYFRMRVGESSNRITAAVARADAFLRGERSSGAEGAESGWLIEIPPFNGQPFWWRAGFEWTSNAHAATRFARRQDAQAVADRVHPTAFVLEHTFFGEEHPDVPPAPKAGEKLPPLGDVVGAMSEMNDLIQKGGKP